MPDPEGAPAPVATATPAAPPAAPPTAPEASPPWLPARLDQAKAVAREELIKELGIADTVKAKEILSAAAKAEEDAKTAAQKLGETSKTLESEKAKRERYERVVASHTERAMSGLTDAQKAAVRAIAPDTDPAAQLHAIDALTPTWNAAPAPVAAPAPEAPKPPANTAPPPNAPPSATASPPNHAAIVAELEKTNPFLAAQYALSHWREVYETQT